jgi:hypothetical protein
LGTWHWHLQTVAGSVAVWGGVGSGCCARAPLMCCAAHQARQKAQDLRASAGMASGLSVSGIATTDSRCFATRISEPQLRTVGAKSRSSTCCGESTCWLTANTLRGAAPDQCYSGKVRAFDGRQRCHLPPAVLRLVNASPRNVVESPTKGEGDAHSSHTKASGGRICATAATRPMKRPPQQCER